MASGTYTLPKSHNTGSYIEGKIEWSSTPKESANTSDITVKLYVRKGLHGGDLTIATTGSWSYSLKIGNDTTTGTTGLTSVLQTWVLILTKTVSGVAHNADGTKSLPITASVTAPTGTAFEGFVTSGSTTVVLDAFKRATTPTVSASSVKIGGTVTINTPRASTSLTHDLQVSIGSLQNMIARGVGDSFPWKVTADYMAGIVNSDRAECTITCITRSGTAEVGRKTCKLTVLAPGPSTLKTSKTTLAVNETVRISIVEDAWYYRHEVKWKIGSGASTTLFSDSSTYADWTPNTSIASQISGKSGTVTFTCDTYNGSYKIGSTSISRTITIPETPATKPVIDNMTIERVEELPDVFNGLFIQGNTARVTYRAHSDTANIAGYATTYGAAKVVTGNPVTIPLGASGLMTVTGRVTDDRGYYAERSMNIEVLEYQAPYIIPLDGDTQIVCERCDASGNPSQDGTSVRLRCRRVYSSLNGKNECTLRYRYKEAVENYYGSWVHLGSDANEIIAGIATDVNKSYTVQVEAFDTMGNGKVLTLIVPSSSETFHLRLGGGGAAFGQHAERFKALEIAPDWDVYLKGEAVGDFVVEVGSSDIWHWRKWHSGRAECWGTATLNSQIVWEWGGFYKSLDTGTRTYPFRFVTRPTEQVTFHTSIYDCFMVATPSISGETTGNSERHTGNYIFVSPEPGNTREPITIDYYIFGYYK